MARQLLRVVTPKRDHDATFAGLVRQHPQKLVCERLPEFTVSCLVAFRGERRRPIEPEHALLRPFSKATIRWAQARATLEQCRSQGGPISDSNAVSSILLRACRRRDGDVAQACRDRTAPGERYRPIAQVTLFKGPTGRLSLLRIRIPSDDDHTDHVGRQIVQRLERRAREGRRVSRLGRPELERPLRGAANVEFVERKFNTGKVRCPRYRQPLAPPMKCRSEFAAGAGVRVQRSAPRR